MPFRDARKSVLQKLRASNHDLSNRANLLHPALPLAFFAPENSTPAYRGKAVGAEDGFVTPRVPATPNTGVAVVLASDCSRYEGDWHQLRHPGEAVLQYAFKAAYQPTTKKKKKTLTKEWLVGGIAAPTSPSLDNMSEKEKENALIHRHASVTVHLTNNVPSPHYNCFNGTTPRAFSVTTPRSILSTPRNPPIDAHGFQVEILKISSSYQTC